MNNYYDVNVIPIILSRFKVKDIIISGVSDKEIISHIFNYCNDNKECSYFSIDSHEIPNGNGIMDFTLNVLPNLRNFDAIFLNDDPNWYTVYNELNLIKKNNHEFPLVFICHNIFPHKRRDSYINPEIIPNEFLNEYSKELIYQDLLLSDEFFHAVHENTPKNGVLTAIEDFIKENTKIGMLCINFLNGMTILYPKNTISKIRIGKIFEEIEGYELELSDLSDNIVENQILTKNIYKMNNDDLKIINELKVELEKQEEIISDFKNQIKIHGEELNLRNSQIDNFDSKLDLKEMQLKKMESQLINKDEELKNLNNHLNNLNDEINYLKLDISKKEEMEYQLNNQFDENVDKLKDKSNQLRIKEIELNEKNHELKSFKSRYLTQSAKLENKKYCISCFKKEIENNHIEIEYFKSNSLFKKFLNPFSYLFLIFKSDPKELSLNIKLYNALKNSKCFDIGFYLNNNEDIKESKWCKYFSPELHYVCNGFNEKRTFNKKYFNKNSKKELLDYILNCKYDL